MIGKNLIALGFALSNAGLMQEVSDGIRAEHPSWNDAKIKKERNKVLKKMTLFSDKNKKVKKPKKVKEPK